MHASIPASILFAVALAAGDARAQGCGGPLPPATQTITLRVSIKRILDGNATPATTWSTTASIATMVANASTLLSSQANVALSYSGTPIDLVDPGIPFYGSGTSYLSWFNMGFAALPELEAAAEADPVRYAWDPDAINIYLVNSLCGLGGISASPPGSQAFAGLGPDSIPGAPNNWNEIIVLANNFAGGNATTAGPTLAHEICHYCDLFHTHDRFGPAPTTFGCNGLASPSPTTEQDLVADTPYDPYFNWSIGGNGALGSVYTGTCGATAIALLTNNLMSYQVTPPYTMTNTLTAGQAARMRTQLWSTRQHVVVGSACPTPTLTAVTPTSAVSPGSVTVLSLAGTNLPTTGFSVQVGQPQCGVPLASPCSFPLGTDLNCPPEAVSTSISAASSTGFTVTFANPIPPGHHSITMRDTASGRVLASLPLALEIMPYIETTTFPLATFNYSIHSRSAVQKQVAFIFGIPTTTGSAQSGVGNLLWIAMPPIFIAGTGNPGDPVIFTDPAGNVTGPWSLGLLGNGTNLGVQLVDVFPTPTFSNLLLLSRP